MADVASDQWLPHLQHAAIAGAVVAVAINEEGFVVDAAAADYDVAGVELAVAVVAAAAAVHGTSFAAVAAAVEARR